MKTYPAQFRTCKCGKSYDRLYGVCCGLCHISVPTEQVSLHMRWCMKGASRNGKPEKFHVIAARENW